jgi:DNA-binding response OmpR family regulator
LKKKVLIAENDEDIRHLVSFILESQGYEVCSCPYTLENLLGMEADLILLDEWINLNEGPMLCKQIKAIERLAHVPVIIFSTAADIEQIASSCQADGYVHKPFDLDTLLAEVHKFLPLNQLQAGI